MPLRKRQSTRMKLARSLLISSVRARSLSSFSTLPSSLPRSSTVNADQPQVISADMGNAELGGRCGEGKESDTTGSAPCATRRYVVKLSRAARCASVREP